MKRELILPPPIRRPGFGRDDHPLATGLQRERILRFRKHARIADRMLMPGLVMLWPFIAAFLAARLVLRLGQRTHREFGKGRLRQWAEQMQISLRWLMWPQHYYMFELYRPGQLAKAQAYLLRAHTKEGVYPLFKNKSLPNFPDHPFKDKAAFARICEEHQIAVAPTLLAGTADGEVVWSAGMADLPKADLFLKPRTGQGGRGAEKWRFEDDGWQRDGQMLDRAGLIAYCRDLSRRQPMLVQPCLVNHPDLGDLTIGALATVRLVTMLDKNNQPKAVAAAFRMPASAASVVDNFHAGGIASAVEIDSGRLNPATDIGLAPDSTWHEAHPLTGARIANRVLPAWAATKDLAIRAHQVFANRVAIGWDIAVTTEGPMIVEANGFPDLDIIQRTQRAPLADSELGHLFQHHLTRLKATYLAAGLREADD
jgi:hypothetical protein